VPLLNRRSSCAQVEWSRTAFTLCKRITGARRSRQHPADGPLARAMSGRNRRRCSAPVCGLPCRAPDGSDRWIGPLMELRLSGGRADAMEIDFDLAIDRRKIGLAFQLLRLMLPFSWRPLPGQ